MKKTVISVLVVLLLSVMVLGCPTGPCDVCGEEPCICQAAGAQNLSVEALAALRGLGFQDGDVLCPVGTKFHDYVAYDATKMYIVMWTEANEAMFESYKSAWLNSRATSIDNTAFNTVTIDFKTSSGTSPKDYPANTIIFTGTGKKAAQ